jgi:Flp pilus assembly protein TadB
MARRKRDERGATAISITSASRSHSEELRGREFRYIVSMGVRTACFLLALVFRNHWVVWVFLAAAVFLPYFAVVVANTGTASDPAGDMNRYDPDRRALGSGPAPASPYDADR